MRHAVNLPGRYAFYGSLRVGLENHIDFAHCLKYVGTAVIHGYRMYSMIDYPYAVKTDNMSETMVVELFEVADSEAEQMIYEMEADAGYILSNIVVDDTKFGVYLFEKADPAHAIVEHGDWRLYWEQARF